MPKLRIEWGRLDGILCVVTGQDTFHLSVSCLVQGLSGGHKSNIDSSLPIQCIWGQQFSCPQTLSMGLWVWWVTKWLNRELNGHSIRTGSLNTNSHDDQTLVCWTESEWTMVHKEVNAWKVFLFASWLCCYWFFFVLSSRDFKLYWKVKL